MNVEVLYKANKCCYSPAIYRNTKEKIKGVKKVRQYLRAAAKHTETAGEIMQIVQTTILIFYRTSMGKDVKNYNI